MASPDILPPRPIAADSGARALFVSYDGLTDPLGRSQILPYLTGLSGRGHRITVLSCEKPDRLAAGGTAVRALCAAAGIDWVPLGYHARPPVLSSVLDLRRLMRAAERLHAEARFDLVHCRSYLPALVGLRLKRRHGVPFLFDMRGFWVEERTESGSWNLKNPVFQAVYRYFKAAEKTLLREAAATVSLTNAAAREIAQREGVGCPTVIPCCVDFDHFPTASPERRAAARAALGLPAEAPVLCYLGSLGGNHLLGEMLDFFRVYRQANPGARFLFVTQSPRAMIDADAAPRAIAPNEIVVRAASREEVPALIAAADLGIAFKRAEYSSLACSPTKLGEMLAEGVPVIANTGVGDVAQVLADTGGGAAIASFDDTAYRSAMEAVPGMRRGQGLRDAALRWFNLDDGVAAYDTLYRRLAASLCGAQTASPGPVPRPAAP